MIAQLIFNSLQNNRQNSFIFKLLQKLRHLLIRINPSVSVNYRYHDYVLKLPLSHEYPFNLKRYPHYSQNLGIIAQFVKRKYPDIKAIDVGANIGDSALILKHYAPMPVLCIEGNPKFLPVLKQNIHLLQDVDVAESYVGEKEGQVETVNYLDTARLAESLGDGGIAVKTMLQVLEAYPGFTRSKLLKVDTDGFDNKILRASKAFIESASPVIFFEYDPKLLLIQKEEPEAIFSFLSALKYTRLLLFNNVGTLLCEAHTDNNLLLKDLTAYFTHENAQYMDICAFHESDADIILPIKDYYNSKQ
jgi:FkbM family methyltransferase